MTETPFGACISCGMPMRRPEDHALSDPSKRYCTNCACPDGSMKSYEEVLKGMVGFLQSTQGIDGQAAREMAAVMLAKQPAWADRA